MSKKHGAIVGFAGAIVGAILGSPYLSESGNCAELGTPQLQCTLNSSVGPFISAIAIGFVLAIAIGHAVVAYTRRAAAPKPEPKRESRDAVEIEDPCLQIAAWGLPPKASQRIVDVSLPAWKRAEMPTGAADALREEPQRPGEDLPAGRPEGAWPPALPIQMETQPTPPPEPVVAQPQRIPQQPQQPRSHADQRQDFLPAAARRDGQERFLGSRGRPMPIPRRVA